MYRGYVTLATALLLGCATTGASAARPPAPPRTEVLTPEMYVGLEEVQGARISPDGAWVAYERTVPRSGKKSGKPRRQVWVVSTAGGTPRRLTTPVFDAWSPRWSPDSKRLAFLSRRKGHHKKPQVFVLPLDGGEAVPLTQHKTGVDAFDWAPDGKRIAFTAMVRKDKKVRKARKRRRDWQVGGVHHALRGLWVASTDADAGKPVQVVGGVQVWDFAWSPAGDQLLLLASTEPGADAQYMTSQIFRLDMPGGTVGDLVQLTRREGKLEGAAWSPDGSRIAFRAAVDVKDPLAGSVFVIPAAGGQARLLTEDLAATVRWVDWLDANTLAIAAIEGTRTMLGRLPASGGALARLPAGEGMCYQPHLAADRQRYACVADTPVHPGEVFVDRMGRGQPQRLTVTNPALETVRFAAQEVVRWQGPGGLEIEGVLIEPLDRRQDQRYPLVVLPHGGPEGSRQSGWLGYPGQLLAARGYVVLYPNYRGSGGRGVAFSKGDHEDLGGKELDDILAGIDHVAGLGLVDTARVGIGGWSYGGYLSALAATRHSERFAAAVMGAGISNWISFTGTTDIPRETSLVHWALWPLDQPALAWERSPLAHLKTAKTPTLILHGAADRRVPPSQGLEMLRGLRHVGVEAAMVTYPREEHEIVERAHEADMVARFLGWFDRHLQRR